MRFPEKKMLKYSLIQFTRNKVVTKHSKIINIRYSVGNKE